MKSRQAAPTGTAMRRQKLRIATRTAATAALAIGMVLPAVAHASLLAASSVCVATSSYGTFLGNSCIRGDDLGQSGPGTIPGGSGVGSGASGFASSAGALQDYGVFHGYASAAGGGTAARGEGGGATATARGIMDDVLTIQGGTGFGYLTFAWTVSGSSTVDGYRGAYANLEMDVQTFASSSQHGSGSLFITQGGVYTIAHLPFFFGQPLDLNVSSLVVAASGYDEGPGGTYAFFAGADFSHTSTLTGITAFDVDGRQISGITITSASGTLYPLSPDAPPLDTPGDPGTPGQVPEPATWLLLAGGLSALAIARRGRHPKVALYRSSIAGPPVRLSCEARVGGSMLADVAMWPKADISLFPSLSKRANAARTTAPKSKSRVVKSLASDIHGMVHGYRAVRMPLSGHRPICLWPEADA